MVVLTTARAQLPASPSSLCLVASCPTYKVGVSKTSCDAAKKFPPTSEGKVIQRWGSNWSNSMISCSYCIYIYMYVYHIHVFSCIGNILLSHPYFQHLFSPKNSTCPITNTSLLLQKEPQRLLRADSLGSFVVFGTDSMGASASLKAAKLCLGKDGGKPNNQAGERQIFFVPIKFWWGPCLASIFFLIMGMPWSLNGMDQYGCHGRIRSLHKIHKHSINYQLFFHPRCTSSTDSLTFTAQQRDLGPDRPAPRQCRCTYLTSGVLKPKPQTHGVNDDPKDFGVSGLENWLETNLAANLSRGLGANWTSMSRRMTLTLECPEICLEHQLLISMWKVGWHL